MSEIFNTIENRLKLYNNLTDRLSVSLQLIYYEIVKPKDIDNHIGEIKQLISGEKDTWIKYKDYESMIETPNTPMRVEHNVNLLIANGRITPSVTHIRDSFNVKTRNQKRYKGKFVKGGVTIEEYPLYKVDILPCIFNSSELYDYQRFVDQFNTRYTTVKGSKDLLLKIVGTLQRQASCKLRLREFMETETGFRNSVEQYFNNNTLDMDIAKVLYEKYKQQVNYVH